MDVYYCLVQTRPGAAPELRDLSCDTDADIPEAVHLATREWSRVELVEVFRNGDSVLVMSGEDLKIPGLQGAAGDGHGQSSGG